MEHPVSLEGPDGTLRGVLHDPGKDRSGTAVCFLHGWTGCRLGPHRMFVHAARRLSAVGAVALRFDFRGRGESDGATADTTIMTMIDDARFAVRWLRDEVRPSTLLLIGICSGGKVALGTAVAESNIGGIGLWSGEALAPLRDAGTETRKSWFVLKTYAGKLLKPATWAKLVTGRVRPGLVQRALFEHEKPTAAECKAEAAILARLRQYQGRVIMVYGTHDPDTALAGVGYVRFMKQHDIPHAFHEIKNANHSFYSSAWEAEVIEVTDAWVRSFG